MSNSNFTDSSCKEIAQSLQACNIACKITNTHSIVPINKMSTEHRYERGCDILITNYNHQNIISTIWNPLQKKYQLGCAYLKIDGIYSGCIYNFERKTNCPGPCSTI